MLLICYLCAPKLGKLRRQLRFELSLDYLAGALSKVVVVEDLEEVFEGENFDVGLVIISSNHVHLQGMQKPLREVDVDREAQPNELLTDFFCREVALLIGVPRLENFLREVHIVTFLNQAHTGVLVTIYPVLDILSDQELLIVHANQSFLLILIVKVAHDLQQAGLGDLRSLATGEHMLLTHLLIDLLEVFALLLEPIDDFIFLIARIWHVLLLRRVLTFIRTHLVKLFNHACKELGTILQFVNYLRLLFLYKSVRQLAIDHEPLKPVRFAEIVQQSLSTFSLPAVIVGRNAEVESLKPGHRLRYSFIIDSRAD